MDILIARPPSTGAMFLYEDLGLEMVCASLRAMGHNCRFLDGEQLMLTQASFVNAVVSMTEPIVCVGVHSEFNVDETLGLTSKIKKLDPNKIIILGGHPLYDLDGEIFRLYPEGFDMIVCGEGEETIVDIVDRISAGAKNYDDIRGISYKKNNKLVRNGARGRIKNYDSLALASRDIWENGKRQPGSKSALIYLSRGCDSCCDFCSVAPFHGVEQRKWIARSIDGFFEEISILHKKYAIRDFTIVDPNFLGNNARAPRHVEDFCHTLKRGGFKIIFDIACRANSLNASLSGRLYDVGWRRVFLGIESASEKMLARWKKAIRPRQSIDTMTQLADIGVLMEIGYILLCPETTINDLRSNFSFLRKLPYFHPSVFTSHIWPIHASLRNACLKEQYLVKSDDRLSFSYYFERDEVAEYYRVATLIADAYKEYFFKMHQKTWVNMFDDPNIIKRYACVTRDLLNIYQDILDRTTEKLGRPIHPKKLDDFVEDQVEHNRDYFLRASRNFY